MMSRRTDAAGHTYSEAAPVMNKRCSSFEWKSLSPFCAILTPAQTWCSTPIRPATSASARTNSFPSTILLTNTPLPCIGRSMRGCCASTWIAMDMQWCFSLLITSRRLWPRRRSWMRPSLRSWHGADTQGMYWATPAMRSFWDIGLHWKAGRDHRRMPDATLRRRRYNHFQRGSLGSIPRRYLQAALPTSWAAALARWRSKTHGHPPRLNLIYNREGWKILFYSIHKWSMYE